MTCFQFRDLHKALCVARIFKRTGYFLGKAECAVLAGKQVALLHFFSTLGTQYNQFLHFYYFTFGIKSILHLFLRFLKISQNPIVQKPHLLLSMEPMLTALHNGEFCTNSLCES